MAQIGDATPGKKARQNQSKANFQAAPKTSAFQSTKKARTETKISVNPSVCACMSCLPLEKYGKVAAMVADYSRGFVFFWNVSGEYNWVVWSYNFQNTAAEIQSI